MRILFTILILTTALSTEAMIISEVAWMGTESSHDDEWIELFADTGAVSLTGWTLTVGTTVTELSGTVPEGSYVLLHRSGETTAPGTPFLTYSGALANGGSSIVLKNAGGSVVTQVAAESGWPSGDNTTKETMQYKGGAWVTAVATPGRAASGTTPPSVNKTTPATNTKTKTSNTKSSGSTILYATKKEPDEKEEDEELALTVSLPDVAYVHQKIEMEAVPKGGGADFLRSLQYEWNFGDLEIAVGKEVQHVYTTPGEYVVYVRAAFAGESVEVRKQLTVQPVLLDLSYAAGDITITNVSAHEVRLDGYTLRGGNTKVFPPRSVLLPQASLQLPASVVAADGFTPLFLYNTAMQLAGHANTKAMPAVQVNTPSPQKSIPPSKKSTPAVAGTAKTNHTQQESDTFHFASDQKEMKGTDQEIAIQKTATATQIAQSDITHLSAETSTEKTPTYAYVALFLLLLFGAGGMLLKGRSE